jgi:hypothetical protein
MFHRCLFDAWFVMGPALPLARFFALPLALALALDWFNARAGARARGGVGAAFVFKEK